MAVAVATTVHITWTSAPKIRMTAKIDMPEYGIRKDETFYLVRSSANNGEYYIVTWNYAAIQWECHCKHSVNRPHAKPCRHRRLVSDDCKKRREAKQAIATALHQDINTFLAHERKEAAIHAAARAGTQEIVERLSRAGLMRR